MFPHGAKIVHERSFAYFRTNIAVENTKTCNLPDNVMQVTRFGIILSFFLSCLRALRFFLGNL